MGNLNQACESCPVIDERYLLSSRWFPGCLLGRSYTQGAETGLSHFPFNIQSTSEPHDRLVVIVQLYRVLHLPGHEEMVSICEWKNCQSHHISPTSMSSEVCVWSLLSFFVSLSWGSLRTYAAGTSIESIVRRSGVPSLLLLWRCRTHQQLCFGPSTSRLYLYMYNTCL